MTTSRTPSTPRLEVRLNTDSVRIGGLTISFHRTLRLPDDGRSYPLPPSLGRFPIHRVADHAERVPESWIGNGGVFLPMHQREAMWLSFDADPAAPVALKVAAGMRNALTGAEWDERIEAGRPQDYVVSGVQPWLDGFNTGEGQIRQFIAMPLGMGYTAEGQLSGEETFGGIQLLAFGTRPGAISIPERRRVENVGLGSPAYFASASAPPDVFAAGPVLASAAPPMRFARSLSSNTMVRGRVAGPGAELGLAAGGRMRQEIHPDPHGADAWDTTRSGRLFVHIIDAGLYQQITGRPAPESPISARTYAEHGLPWFEKYAAGDIAPAPALGGLSSVAEKDAEHGFSVQDDASVDIAPGHVRPLGPAPFSDPVR